MIITRNTVFLWREMTVRRVNMNVWYGKWMVKEYLRGLYIIMALLISSLRFLSL